MGPAYAGDLQGNVWRVDITDPSPANWIVSVMFQTTDPGGAPQPITTVPAVTLNPKFPNLLRTMVYVGTGQLLGVPDLSTKQVQTMYGIYDPPTGATRVRYRCRPRRGRYAAGTWTSA
jgi:type IV pilus assembly protein PilY1